MNKKVNVFLDLDNTLISSIPSDVFPSDDPKVMSLLNSNFKYHNMDNIYVVFERPHVQEFLDYVFDNYNVSVWTAASKSYALFIIDKVILTKPGRHLDYVLYDSHTKHSDKKYKTIKKLDTIWEIYKLPGYDKSNTIIIDDLPEVHKSQPNNSIQIKEFEIFKNPKKALKQIKQNINEPNEFENVIDKLADFENQSDCGCG